VTFWHSRCSGSTDEAGVGLTTLRLTIEYRGGAFHGFQWQPELRTVAGVLEDRLSRLLSETVKVCGAGRTDAGVHATGQVVSFTTDARLAAERVAQALNAMLPSDCSLREVARVDAAFSARFSAVERKYVYLILATPSRSALLAGSAWHVPKQLDVAAMQAAAQHTIGEHDFRSFACGSAPARRRVHRFSIERRGDLVRAEITANAFVHRMVRSLVGTLVECGSGSRSPDEMPAILAAADRSAAGPVAPAQGLYLAGVRYPEYDSFKEPPLLGA
jgi:tRNA pseudouridine38-40 synthase